MLHILIKLLELIYYKTVPHELREQAFIGSKMKKAIRRLDDDDDERAEFIAREFLDILAEKILKIIHSLIKAN